MVTQAPRSTSTHDLDLQRRVVNFLFSRKVPALRRIAVEADNGVVTLRGQVPSFYQRQLCINCCSHVAGVNRVIDQVEVVEPLQTMETVS